MRTIAGLVATLLLAGGAMAAIAQYTNPTVGSELALQVPGMHEALVKVAS